MSNIYVMRDEFAPAEEMLELVLDEFPEDVGAMNDLGYLWAERNIHLQRAFRMILRAVAEEPENLAYLDSLGWIQYRLGKFGDAVETLEKAAVGEDPDGVILDHLAEAYWKNKQRRKAMTAWRRALKNFEKQQDQQQVERVQGKLQRGSKSGDVKVKEPAPR
jgi:tetratricopeptide (TPR) repeat protein